MGTRRKSILEVHSYCGGEVGVYIDRKEVGQFNPNDLTLEEANELLQQLGQLVSRISSCIPRIHEKEHESNES